MEIRQLGNSGLRVSALGLGGNNFGWWADQETANAVIRAALEKGINFFDTASIYGEGSSEEWLGKALKSVRRQAVIATKFGFPIGKGPNASGGSAHHIRQAVEDSLRRLQTDYIDLYQMHFPDPKTPIDETLRALDDLIRKGSILYIGCSNFTAWQLSDALFTSKMLNLNSFISIQAPYNLINRQIECDLLPCSIAHGLGVITYTPLAGGFLTGKYRKGKRADDSTRFGKFPEWGSMAMTEENFDILGRLDAFAAERGHTVADLAIAWLLSRSGVSTVIAGATNPEQLMANVDAVDWKLSSAEMAEIDQITLAHLGIGKDAEGASRAICPWCNHQTRVRIPEGAIITGVQRADSFPPLPPSDPSLILEMCNSCLAPFYLSQRD